MKVGRNDRCPCGSGKKYKVCCGAAPETESSDTLAWRRLSRAIENHTAKLFSFIEETYGPEAIPEAWEEFTLWSEEPFTPDDPQVTLFYPWLFHHWSPDPADTAVEARCLHEISPTQAYLIARGQDLDVALYRYLSACLDSPFGFYEVVGVEPGSGLRLREILTETLHHVRERSASSTLQVDDTLYGMVVECDGVEILEACAPVAFPLRLKPRIIEQREALLESEAIDRAEVLKAIADAEAAEPEGAVIDERPAPGTAEGGEASSEDGRLSAHSLFRYDFAIRELYWDLVIPLLHPQPPTLHNTDGDRVSMRRLVFDIDSAADAFAALKVLALGMSEDELRAAAEYGADGALQRVAFAWTKRGNSTHKDWETTVLGHLRIEGTRLTADVNSAPRAAEFKRRVSELMGDHARYRMTQIQTMEAAHPPVAAHGGSSAAPADPEQAALMASPEVQAHLRDLFARHYEGWIDEKLPALQGKTPQQAVRTAAGREKVEALIKDIERMGPGTGGYDVSVTQRLRERLGLLH